MGVRSTLASLLSAPATRLLERELRELVEDVLAGRPVAHAADLEALRAEVAELRGAREPGSDARVSALETEVESLKKRLGMAMGAVQASTAQLMQVKQAAEEAHAAARHAGQNATSAKATAEAAVDGITGVEERLDSLIEQIGTARAEPPRVEEAAPLVADQPVVEEEGSCRVPGCTSEHRAKGFCARHYQKFRRSRLEGFVGPDGMLPLDDATLEVGRDHAGKYAQRVRGQLLLDGEPVAVER